MVGEKRAGRTGRAAPARHRVTLKDLAARLGLTPATISIVINRTPASHAIPERTRRRILEEAQRLDYRPSFLAQSLRRRRSFTVGVVVPEVSEGYTALVMSGIEDHLLREGYFYFVVSHRHRPDLVAEYPRILQERAIEGLIAVDTPCANPLPIPVVCVSGHQDREGITNIVLDHAAAASSALRHLARRGHRHIAFLKGQAFSSDTEPRWAAIRQSAEALQLPFSPERCAQIVGDSSSPVLGYHATRELLARDPGVTAIFAFNDVAAIGAIRALREAGRKVPEDVSVVGFDDIQSAAFQNPSLTTIRQPLRQMGEIAARTLLDRIARPDAPYPRWITVKPQLIVRESTGPAPECHLLHDVTPRPAKGGKKQKVDAATNPPKVSL